MSAPEVGDRVRVIAGQWVGHHAWVAEVLDHGHLWLRLYPPSWSLSLNVFMRSVPASEVETVPTTRTQPPQRPEDGSGAPVEAQAAHGAHRGGKR